MGTYNPVERSIARLLGRFPRVKQGTKSLYQRGNYAIFGDRDFSTWIHPATSLSTPGEWFAGTRSAEESFYGYFDTTPWNDSTEQAIYQHLSQDTTISIHLYDHDGNLSIATTDAWNYQQGSRLQWHPTHDDRILFNDTRDGELVTRVVDVSGAELDCYDWPLQAISPCGEEFITLNYHRLDRNRPDYGYGLNAPTAVPEPSRDGLWRVNFDDGSDELLISLADLIDNDVEQKNHYLNHVLYNPSGDRFVFLHRWRDNRGRNSRLYVSENVDEPLLDWSTISHYCWLDDEQLLVWGISETFGSNYHVVDTISGEVTALGVFEAYGDGHPSLSPDGRWIVTDTYPDRARQRYLLLYDRREEREIELGRFLSPFEYEGVSRCDLHPRWSPDGTAISIDSTHEGIRRSYVLDVEEIVGR